MNILHSVGDRQYGTSSYDIHLKQCKELWIAREAQKDPKERKPLPEDPLLSMGINSSSDSFRYVRARYLNVAKFLKWILATAQILEVAEAVAASA
jgi:hypothetical protein